jgi:hypothetical protein
MTALIETLINICNSWLKRIHERKEAKRRDKDARLEAERKDKALKRELMVAANVIKHDADTSLFNETLRNKVNGTDYIDITQQGLKAMKKITDDINKEVQK